MWINKWHVTSPVWIPMLLPFLCSNHVPRSYDLENRKWQYTMYSTISIPMHLPTYPNATTHNRWLSPTVSELQYCTQSKCKAALPDGYKYKTCEKCQNISKLGMQKKEKQDKADEGPSHNSHLEEDSDTELKQRVSRFTSWFLKELLPKKLSRKMLPLPLKTKVLWWPS